MRLAFSVRCEIAVSDKGLQRKTGEYPVDLVHLMYAG